MVDPVQHRPPPQTARRRQARAQTVSRPLGSSSTSVTLTPSIPSSADLICRAGADLAPSS